MLTPSQFTTLARSLLEDSFPLVEIEGELSGVSRPASGHLYFALKDSAAQVRCAMFRPRTQRLSFRPDSGDLVLARGRATLYEPRGDFQLIIEHLEPAGEGALRAAFEALKRTLDAEGLFQPERKRPIPAWISRLGVLSSPGGAAIHDVLSVLRRRFPLIEVDLLPIPVQGSGTVSQVIAMLQKADKSKRYDALLLTRGGGSLEDLVAFNDESLARALFVCRTPSVVAIGHETDTCIAELVADRRAPTPSAAAESLVPDQASLRAQLLRARHQLSSRQESRQQSLAQKLDQLQARLQQQHPHAQLTSHRSRLQDLTARLRLRQHERMAKSSERLQMRGSRLRAQAPQRQLKALRSICADALERLGRSTRLTMERHAQRTASLNRALQAVAPSATLARGYAILQDSEGRVLTDAGGVAVSSSVRATLRAGELQLTVTDIRP